MHRAELCAEVVEAPVLDRFFAIQARIGLERGEGRLGTLHVQADDFERVPDDFLRNLSKYLRSLPVPRFRVEALAAGAFRACQLRDPPFSRAPHVPRGRPDPLRKRARRAPYGYGRTVAQPQCKRPQAGVGPSSADSTTGTAQTLNGAVPAGHRGDDEVEVIRQDRVVLFRGAIGPIAIALWDASNWRLTCSEPAAVAPKNPCSLCPTQARAETDVPTPAGNRE